MTTRNQQQVSLQFPDELTDPSQTEGMLVAFEIFDRSGARNQGNFNRNVENPEAFTGTRVAQVNSSRSSSLRTSFGGYTKNRGVILLPMPANNLQFNYGQGWNAEEIGNTVGSMARQIAGFDISTWQNFKSTALAAGNTALDSLERGAVGALSALTPGNAEAAYFNLYKGKVFNPFVEVLYQGGTHRSFNFTYILAPKSKEESEAVDEIIRVFKYYAHPTLKSSGGASLSFFTPPGVFDLRFLTIEPENPTPIPNPYLPGLSSCALTNIEVDYHGSGERSYHRDKTPSIITLTLSFMEMEMLTRDRFERNRDGVSF